MLSYKRISLFPKLLLVFFLVIVPVFIICLLLIQSAESNLKKEISVSMESKAHFYSNAFETEINRINELKNQLIFDENFQNLGLMAPIMSESERRTAILRIQEKLRLLKGSSLYVEDIKVYFPILGKSITTRSYDEAMTTEEIDAMGNFKSAHGSSILRWRGGLYLSSFYPQFVTDRDRLTMIIAISLSTAKIMKHLEAATESTTAVAVLLDKAQYALFDVPDDIFFRNGSAGSLPLNWKANTPSSHDAVIDGRKYMFFYESSPLTGITYTLYIPEKDFLGKLQTYRFLYGVLLIIAVLAVFLFSYWIYGIVHKPVLQLVRSFRRVEEGDFSIRLQHKNYDEFHYLYGHFNKMLEKLKLLIQEVYEQEIRSQRAELKQLQSQINPHFLYNSFFTLSCMADTMDMDNVQRFTRHLGDYFKFVTRSGSEEIPLELEIQHAMTYVEIQTIRFGDQIKVAWEDIPAAGRGIPVPRLILQPLIENAYAHGLEDHESQGMLKIGMRVLDNDLFITVEDNGEGMEEETLRRLQEQLTISAGALETTGLINVHRRLQLRYGPEYGLAVSCGKMGGLSVQMKLPLAG